MISIIAAVAQNLAIGYRNQLLYWLPNDLRRFRLLTTGHTIVMGRRTFESLPKGALPNRRNIVLSRSTQEFPGAEVFPCLENALQSCGEDEEVYIIGGASVYAAALPFADRLCLTEISDTPVEADAFFPEFSTEVWQEINREHHDKDERHPYAYDFVDYMRKKIME